MLFIVVFSLGCSSLIPGTSDSISAELDELSARALIDDTFANPEATPYELLNAVSLAQFFGFDDAQELLDEATARIGEDMNEQLGELDLVSLLDSASLAQLLGLDDVANAALSLMEDRLNDMFKNPYLCKSTLIFIAETAQLLGFDEIYEEAIAKAANAPIICGSAYYEIDSVCEEMQAEWHDTYSTQSSLNKAYVLWADNDYYFTGTYEYDISYTIAGYCGFETDAGTGTGELSTFETSLHINDDKTYYGYALNTYVTVPHTEEPYPPSPARDCSDYEPPAEKEQYIFIYLTGKMTGNRIIGSQSNTFKNIENGCEGTITTVWDYTI